MAVVNSRHRANVKQESQPGSQVSLLYEQYTGDMGKVTPALGSVSSR